MSQPKDNSSPNEDKCCGKCPGKSCQYNKDSKESVKSQDTSKSGRSFTEVVQTKANATVKYIVHGKSGQDGGLPDIELSTASSEKAATSAVPMVNPSELEDIAKLMDEHQRENAERMKQKEKEKAQLNATGDAKKCSRSTSNESSQETIDTQRKLEAMKAKDCCKDSCANGPSK